MKIGRSLAAIAAAATFASVSLGPGGLTAAAAAHGPVVYTESNAPMAAGGNTVLAFIAGPDGELAPAGSFATGGYGTGAGLGSQGALALSGHGSYLVAVNAGSNSVSAFAVEGDGSLRLLDTVPSGGVLPVSVAIHNNMAYVLNAGDNLVAGFRLGPQGLVPGDHRALSPGAAGAAEIAVSPDGMDLLVTDKGSDTLDTIMLMPGGMLGKVMSTPATGQVPYGFAFTRGGVAVVSDAGNSALTTYVLRHGTPRAVGEVADGQQAACWVAVTRNGIAFTTDAHSGNLSSYRVGPNGRLTLLAAVAATTGGTPVDLALSPTERWLYVLNAGPGTIDSIPVGPRGFLGTPAPVAIIPPASAGMVVAGV